MVEITKSIARGVDGTQASLYAYAKALGTLTGIDTLTRYGEDGVRRNLMEMQENLPTIASWDDVDSLADFGTYALEAIAEQIPGFGMDAAAFLTGAGAGTVIARRAALSKIQKAQIGKVLKRQVGEAGYESFIKKKVSAGAAAGGSIALGTSLLAQNTGESQMQFDEEGLGDKTGSIMLAGAAKAALDKLPLDSVIGIARRANVPAQKLPDIFAEAAKQVGIIGAKESVTEGMQTFVDQFAIHAHKPETELFSEKNLKQIKESMILGGIVGGSLGGTMSFGTDMYRYKAGAKNIEEDLDAFTNDRLTQNLFEAGKKNDDTVPEDPASVQAQIKAMPAKPVVFLSPHTTVPDNLPPWVTVHPRPNGTYLSSNPEMAKFIEDIPIEDIGSFNGAILYGRPEEKNHTDGTVIVVRNEDNVPITEVATHSDTIDRDMESVASHMPVGGSIEVVDATSVIKERIDRLMNSGMTQEQKKKTLDILAAGEKARLSLNKRKENVTPRSSTPIEEQAEIRETVKVFKDGEIVSKHLQKSYNDSVDDERLSTIAAPKVSPEAIDQYLNSKYTPGRRKQIKEALASGSEESARLYKVVAEEARIFSTVSGMLEHEYDAKDEKGNPILPRAETFRLDTEQVLDDAAEIPQNFVSAKARDEFMANLPRDTNIQYYPIDLPDGGFTIHKKTLPDELAPEPTVDVSRQPRQAPAVEVPKKIGRFEHEAEARRYLGKMRRDNHLVSEYDYSIGTDTDGAWTIFTARKPRTVNRVYLDGVAKAIETGAARQRLANKLEPGKQKEMAQGTIIRARDRSGKLFPLTTPDLSSFGREILGAEKAQDMTSEDFARAGLETAIARMMARGWDMSDAFDPKSVPKRIEKGTKVSARKVPTRYREGLLATLDENIVGRKFFSKYTKAQPRSKRHISRVPFENVIGQNKFIPRDRASDMLVEVQTWIDNSPEPARAAQEASDVVEHLMTYIDDNITTFRTEKRIDGFGEEVIVSKTQVRTPMSSLHESYLEAVAEGTTFETDDSFIYDIDSTLDASTKSLAALDSERLRAKPPGTDKKYKKEEYEIGNVARYGSSAQEAAWVQGLFKAVGMSSMTTAIVRANGPSLAMALKDKVITREEHDRIAKEIKSSNVAGIFIPKGGSGVIVISPYIKGGKRLQVLGHEVGHAVYNNFLHLMSAPKGKKIPHKYVLYRNRLKAAYKQDVDENGYNKPFDEWFADNIVSWGGKLTEKPIGAKDRIFYGFAEALKKVWDTIKEAIGSNKRFDRVINALVKDKVFINNTNVGFGKWEFMTDTSPATVGDVVPQDILLKVKQAARNLPDLASVPVLKHVFAAGAELRAISPQIADLIEKESNTAGSRAYNVLRQQSVDEWSGRLHAATTKYFNKRNLAAPGVQAELKEAYLQLATERPQEELTPLAASLRQVINDFHRYMKARIPTLGKIDNFFPHNWARDQLSSRPSEFLDILEHHKHANGADVLKTLLGETTGKDMLASDELGGVSVFRRSIKDPALIADLVEAKFLNTNPVDALKAYIYRGTTQASYAEAFSGYRYLKGYTTARVIYKNRAEEGTVKELRRGNAAAIKSYIDGIPGLPSGSYKERVETAIKWGYLRVHDVYDPKSKQKIGNDFQYWDPNHVLKAHIAQHEKKLSEKATTPHQVEKEMKDLRNLIAHSLGLKSPDKNTQTYKILGEVRAYQALRTLLFSGVASIPEVGLSFIKNRGVLTVSEYSHAIADSIKHYESAEEFAALLGIARDDITAAVASEMFDQPTQGVLSKHIPTLFKYNGNTKLVSFSKVLSTSIATAYLAKLARDPHTVRHQRYLTEMGVSSKVILRWEAAGKQPASLLEIGSLAHSDAQAVGNAINMFVQESVIRPNHTDRPAFANNMYGSMIFQLKSFSYAFSRGPLMGVVREFSHRLDEGDPMAQKLVYLLPAATLMLLLGGVSDELRQRAISFGEKGTWEGNREDTTKTLSKWFDRSGMNAVPFSSAMADPVSVSNLTFDLGPTVSQGYSLIAGDDKARQKLMQAIPVFSQMPQMRKAVYKAIEAE